MAGFMDSGVSTNIATTTAGLILNSHVAPAATNAYVNYDGTNLVSNVPTGKGFSFNVNGTGKATIDTSGNVFSAGYVGLTTALRLHGVNTSPNLQEGVAGQITYNASAADGVSAIDHVFSSSVTLATAGAKLLSVQNNGTEKFSVALDGSIGMVGTTITGSGANTTIQGGGSLTRIADATGSNLYSEFRGVSANLTSLQGQADVSHLAGGSGVPTNVTLGTGCGAAQSGANNAGSDLGGTIGGTCGSAGTGGGPFVTITWARAYNTAPYVTISPANSATAALSGATQVFPTPGTTTLAITAGATAPPAGTYLWFYKVNQ